MDAARRPVPVPVPGFGFRGQAAAVAGSASALLARVLPRRTYSSSRVRSIAVFSLACVSLLATTLILHAWLFASPPPHHLHHQYNLQMKRQQQYMDSPRVHHKPDHPAATSVSAYTFADHPEMELGAVVNFLTLLSSNSLPVSIDPGQYIDPDLVLGFDTRADDDRVQIEVESIVEDTWLHNPVVIFSEVRLRPSQATLAAAPRRAIRHCHRGATGGSGAWFIADSCLTLPATFNRRTCITRSQDHHQRVPPLPSADYL